MISEYLLHMYSKIVLNYLKRAYIHHTLHVQSSEGTAKWHDTQLLVRQRAQK